MKTQINGLGSAIKQAAVIIVAASALSAAVNAARPDGIPLIYKNDQILNQQISGIELEEAKRLYDSGTALILDARTEEEFRSGHIEGALHICCEDFDEENKTVLDDVPFDRPLITYCGGSDCMSSVYLADLLADLGYERIYVFFGGWTEWKSAGYPVKEPWTTGR